MPQHAEEQFDSLALTYRQVARAANISERMVRKLVRRGTLTAVRIGRSVRVPRTEVLRLCGASEHQIREYVEGRRQHST
jgi:excisionase family DNA binding protein